MKERKWNRRRRFVKHHIRNRIFGGTKTQSNLIRMDEEREKAFHFLFHNFTFQQAAQILLRVDRLKKGGRDEKRNNLEKLSLRTS